jgi:hypothetical protein
MSKPVALGLNFNWRNEHRHNWSMKSGILDTLACLNMGRPRADGRFTTYQEIEWRKFAK